MCAKRLLDTISVVLLLPVALPLMGIIALAIKLEGPRGSVLFKPKRVTKDGHIFSMYKFRTMVEGAAEMYDDLAHLNTEITGLIIKIPNDPRVTKVGRFLRRTSLDELPQLFNILRGEMSLVGPRPPSPEEAARYSPRHRRRLEALGGLSGLWQVSGRKETSFEEMVDLDIEYVERRSLWLDVRILLKTIPSVLVGRGAR